MGSTVSGHASSMSDARTHDAELGSLQERCRSLEQQCAWMHGALQKGQAACEHWRRRGLGVAAATPQGDTSKHGSESFALGPSDKKSLATSHDKSFADPVRSP